MGLVFGILFGGSSLAIYSNEKSYSGNGWNTPIYGQIEFAAHFGNGYVETEWSKFQPKAGESFKYYKVIRSNSNNNPVYPDDGYIKYSSDINFTEFKDTKPKSAYYRVCAMTHAKNRYCSNVVWVDVANSDKYKNTDKYEKKYKYEYEEKTEKPKYEKKVKANFSWEIQQKLDKWLDKLELKLKNSNLTTAQKIEKINKIQGVLESITLTRPAFVPIVTYLNSRLTHIQEEFKANDLSDLDSLLDGLLD